MLKTSNMNRLSLICPENQSPYLLPVVGESQIRKGITLNYYEFWSLMAVRVSGMLVEINPIKASALQHQLNRTFSLSPAAQKQQGGFFCFSLHAPGAAFCIRRIPGKLMHYLLG